MVEVAIKTKIEFKQLSVFYKAQSALSQITFSVRQNEILGIIGPANSGKTTLLRTLNRLNDLDQAFRMEGEILMDGEDVYKQLTAATLRRRVGMIFALPVPLPLSIFENVAYGPRVHGARRKSDLYPIVEKSLSSAFLCDNNNSIVFF